MFMIWLVVSANFVQFFFAWEGVGLCSYLLISFWYTRLAAVRAALEAIVFNRVGDFSLLLAICLCANVFHTVDFSIVFSTASFFINDVFLRLGGFELTTIDLIGLCFVLSMVAKSAQLGLHVWLPDAMEGPTPVSALLHSSTMVVAGVFLLLRCSPLIEYSNLTLSTICFLGAVTSFFSASIGLVQFDLKKIIAYSTCSQLGYMVFACGVSAYSLSFYHLFNHAFFKSLLFLASGVVIHALDDEQDIRRMGGLAGLLPFTCTVILIGSLSLSGFPFLSGFYSKDAILEVCLGTGTTLGWFCASLGLLTAFLTSFYSYRLLYLVFFSKPRLSLFRLGAAHEPDLYMLVPLFVLSICSVFMGYLSRDLFIGLGTDYWVNSFFSLPTHCSLIFYEFLPVSYKVLPILFSFFGFLVSFVFYQFYSSRLSFVFFFCFKNLYAFLSRRWYVDYLWTRGGRLGLSFFYFVFRLLDQGWLTFLGPLSFQSFFIRLSNVVYEVQSGHLFHYLFIFFICTCVLFLISFGCLNFDFVFICTFVLIIWIFF
jgi:proton-translocating NADH-quinone oxidoreductase chain L